MRKTSFDILFDHIFRFRKKPPEAALRGALRH